MKRVAFHTLGCKLNYSETSAIGRQFSEAGFEKVDFEAEAEVYVINTCSVTEHANAKCRHTVRQALRQNPGAYVVVVGCYAQLKPDEIAAIPGVDLVLGAGDKFRILELAGEFSKAKHACVYNSQIKTVDTFTAAYSSGDRTRSFLKIQDGCDYKCAFCTIPLARGGSRSDSIENVLQNARDIAAKGVREIVLTGVNIGDYGTNQPHSFLDVVKALDAEGAVPRFRISSIEPNLCHDGIIEAVAESRHFMPHFHMPLQSGNDEILARMRRRYRRGLYAERVARIRQLMPDACIGVDVITGFPGESELHFMDTFNFLQDLEVSYFHVFTYSERENTAAWDMDGVVPPAERQQRTRRLRMLSDMKRMAFYRRFEGQQRPVLFEQREAAGLATGFSDNYIQVSVAADTDLGNALLPVQLSALRADGLMGGQLVPLAIA